MREQHESEQRPATGPGKPEPDGFVPPVDLAAVAAEFGMFRAAAYLRAMGNQLPVGAADSANTAEAAAADKAAG